MTGAITHGHTRGRSTTPEFNSWLAMRQRCTYPSHEKYQQYGARGIRVCARWMDSFEAFLSDMGSRPKGKTLDRIDPNGDYEPANCRWATPKEQARNRKPFKTNNAMKTHCPAGHEYAGENVRKTASGRKCRACDRERARRNRNSRRRRELA